MCRFLRPSLPGALEDNLHFDYKQFRIDVTPLAFHGHYFARAIVYQCGSDGELKEEIRWSGDTGKYSNGKTAMEVARQWAGLD